MEQYFSELYFMLLVYAVIGYGGVWLIAFILARPFVGIVRGGNPYPSVYNCWMLPLLVHTLAMVSFSAFTTREMSVDERETLHIVLYNLGFIVLLIINFVVVYNLWKTKRKIRY